MIVEPVRRLTEVKRLADQPHYNRIQKGGLGGGGVSLMAESLRHQGNIIAQKTKDGKYVYVWVCMLCVHACGCERQREG